MFKIFKKNIFGGHISNFENSSFLQLLSPPKIIANQVFMMSSTSSFKRCKTTSLPLPTTGLSGLWPQTCLAAVDITSLFPINNTTFISPDDEANSFWLSFFPLIPHWTTKTSLHLLMHILSILCSSIQYFLCSPKNSTPLFGIPPCGWKRCY